MKKKTGREKDSGWKNVRIILVAIFLAALLVGFYFYLSNKTERQSVEDTVVISRTQQVLSRNLEANYPPSPREVVKYYSEITQCFYNEELSEEELEELALQIRRLYADELAANQTLEEYMDSLRRDIASMKKEKYVISSYSLSASTDVIYDTKDGKEWAKLYCLYNIRKGTAVQTSNEVFILQRDDDGHWKIFGWKLAQ